MGMYLTIVYIQIMAIFILDIIAYGFAKYPERKKIIYMFPLGGLIALIKFGRDKVEVEGE